MYVTGVVPKSGLYQAICDAIVSPGSNWVQISSNPTEDGLSAGTDGKIFKGPPIGVNNQSVIFRMKMVNHTTDWASGVGNIDLRFYLSVMENYTPGSAGSNGVMTNPTPVNSIYGSAYYHVINNADEPMVYHVLIEDHRIIIIFYRQGFTNVAYKTMIYIGYPDLNNNFEVKDTIKNVFLIGAGTYAGSTSRSWSNLILKAGTTYYETGDTAAEGNLWYNITDYDPAIKKFSLYPVPIPRMASTLAAFAGVLFHGYLDGIYILPAITDVYLVDRDILVDGADQYLVIGTSNCPFYMGQGFLAIKLQ